MTVPRLLMASAVAAGLAFGSAGVVMAASNPPSSPGSDDAPQVSASPDATPSPTPSASFGDDVPAEVVAGLSEIPQSAAVAVAQAAVGGGADHLERAVLKIEDGRLVWDVRFTSDSRVEVDALTGEAVKVEVRSAGASQAGRSAEPGDDNGGERHSGDSVEAGDDHGGHRGSGGSAEAGDDHSDSGNSGRGGNDD